MLAGTDLSAEKARLSAVPIAAATAPVWLTVVLATPPSVIAIVAIVVGQRQQAATLTHERDQQRERLEYERQLADLDEIRTLLDECARTVYAASSAIRDIFIRGREDQSVAALLEQHVQAVLEVQQRLTIRFGVEDELVDALEVCIDALLLFYGEARVEGPMNAERSRADQSRFGEGRDKFLREASRRAGTRLPS